jgi:2-C-methyl-D-erythritol 2,4-cyclodiphosphate synthase
MSIAIRLGGEREALSSNFFPRMSCPFKIGIGYDIHPFAEGRPLILGGVTIPFHRGLSGHSDADVLCHAIIDALLGAMAWPNIGQRYPDSDPRYADISSIILLENTLEDLWEHFWEIANIDTILIAQQPKISPFIDAIRHQLSKILRIPVEDIGVKATTHEHLDAIGKGKAIACHASCLLHRKDIDQNLNTCYQRSS